MKKTDNMPIWVYIAFSNITTRKGALLLIWACVIFSIYCIPWSLFFASHGWLTKIFLIKDWSWFAMMIPIIFWYWISLRWIDNNSGWVTSKQKKEQLPARAIRDVHQIIVFWGLVIKSAIRCMADFRSKPVFCFANILNTSCTSPFISFYPLILLGKIS